MPLGRIVGVEVRLHWTFFALLLVVVAANAGDGAKVVLGALLWVVAVFGSVLLHEAAHCVVARRRGAVVEGILLTPVAGLSRMHDLPETPRDELAVAIVGPLVNFVLAALLAVAGLAAGMGLWPPTLFAGGWIARMLWMNVLLGGFNLLPALPMDGGWVLRSVLERHRDRRAAAVAAAEVSRVVAVVMIAAGILYDFWLVVLGLIVLAVASAGEPPPDGRRHDQPPGPGTDRRPEASERRPSGDPSTHGAAAAGGANGRATGRWPRCIGATAGSSRPAALRRAGP